jgi:5'(3')-deoxyribonucleotidase
MVIYLDVDGVLANWVGAINDWADKPVNTPWHDYLGYRGIGITDEQTHEYMSNVSFWTNIELLPKAKELLALCKSISRTYICTRPFPHPNCLYGRAVWLEEKLGVNIRDVIFCHDKELLANEHSVLIDDNPTNIENFSKSGGNAMLYPQPYNVKLVPTPAHKLADIESNLRNILKLQGWMKNG